MASVQNVALPQKKNGRPQFGTIHSPNIRRSVLSGKLVVVQSNTSKQGKKQSVKVS